MKELTDKIREMNELRTKIDALAEEKTELQKRHDALAFVEIPDLMDEAGVDLLKVEGVGRVKMLTDLRVSCPNKVAMFKWLDDNGHSHLISETVNASTLKAFVKEQMGKGVEMPDIFKVTPFSRVTITRG